MPLRDHFRPPVSSRHSWEGFHGVWPMVIIQHLRKHLPPGFVAEPRVHLGAMYEVDVSTYETDDPAPRPDADARSGTAAATFPVVSVETEVPDEYEYEVRVYDADRERTLVAAIEIVSPANKGRRSKRNAFVGKCAELLRRGVAVSVVDLVTVRQFNLFAELMAFIGHDELAPADRPPAYAASCRWVPRDRKALLQTVSLPLEIGRPLPTLPLWLGESSVVPLDLEASYEQTCHDLWIT